MILPKRVRDKIEFQHSTHPDRTACWIWTGYIKDGMPTTSLGADKGISARRYIYETLRKPIPDGKQLRRACPNSSCVNPNHMEIRKDQQ